MSDSKNNQLWQIRGPQLWAELHNWAKVADVATARTWLENYSRRIPCGECRQHWATLLHETPPDVSSNEGLFSWTVAAHNIVNRRLGKSAMPLDLAKNIWNYWSKRAKLPAPTSTTALLPLNTNFAVKSPGGASIVSSRGPAIDCEHATASNLPTHVICSLGLYGGQPHINICRNCPSRTPILPISREQHASTLRIPQARPHAARPEPYDFGKRSEFGKASDPGANALILRSFLSPGDIVMLTAAVRDLHRALHGKFLTAIETSVPELWENNPFVLPSERLPECRRVIDMHYPLINNSNQRPVHFMQGYIEYLSGQLGIPIPVTEFRGDIHLSENEKRAISQVQERFGYRGRFWIMIAGGKYDFTTKWWPPGFYQHVVDHFMGRLQFVQCGQKDHWHPRLKGAFDLVGETSTRQFIQLMHHAEGVVCPITFAMHLAAAVPTKNNRLRPCVVIAGGREPPHWEAYPGHQFLHTIGCLPCCATGGCWKSRCQRVGDGDTKDRQNMCERPVQINPDLFVPQCMAMVQPKDVINAVERAMAFDI